MNLILGLVVVFGCVVGGYVMHHGPLAVLWQPSEFIILGGAALGGLIIKGGVHGVKVVFSTVMGLLKPSPYGQKAYTSALVLMYRLFMLEKDQGAKGIEQHTDKPHDSSLFQMHPEVLADPAAVALIADTYNLQMTSPVTEHTLADIMEADIDAVIEQDMHPQHAVQSLGDAMPAFGIVAAVLGIIITMGSIGGSASEVGQKVAAALVGTFLGVLLAYGVFAPLAGAIQERVDQRKAFLKVIRTAMVQSRTGGAGVPRAWVEMARREVLPELRPTFAELEEAIQQARRPG